MIARRALLATAAATAALRPAAAAPREVVDDAGRRVRLPERIGRIFPAAPPAAITLFALAPDTLLGCTNPWREADRACVDPRWADLPVVGRLTGRGGTANLETVLALRPDLIVDYGSVDRTYASLADSVQEQTGIPLFCSMGASTPSRRASARSAACSGGRSRARPSLPMPRPCSPISTAAWPPSPRPRDRKCTKGAARTGCRRGLPARSTSRRSSG